MADSCLLLLPLLLQPGPDYLHAEEDSTPRKGAVTSKSAHPQQQGEHHPSLRGAGGMEEADARLQEVVASLLNEHGGNHEQALRQTFACLHNSGLYEAQSAAEEEQREQQVRSASRVGHKSSILWVMVGAPGGGGAVGDFL